MTLKRRFGRRTSGLATTYAHGFNAWIGARSSRLSSREYLKHLAFRTFKSHKRLGTEVWTLACRCRGIVEARAIVSAKRWTTRTVPVDEVRNLRGLKGEEDTAIVVTTGRFSQEARDEAKPGQNQRIVYLIDGEKLTEVCKLNQIGVKKVQLPELLILDPELTRESSGVETLEAEGSEPLNVPELDDSLSLRRLRDEMLGDSDRGLSAEEVAELSAYSLN